MEQRDVIAFLDWLTAGGNQMEYAIVNPRMIPDEKPDFYRNHQRVTVDDMNRRANNWLEETGRTPTATMIAWLVREALQKVGDDHVYPRTH